MTSQDPRIAALLAGRPGLRVIPDVHGNWTALQPLLAGADRAGLATLFLGDLVDRGPDSPTVVREVLRRLDAGTALLLPGNHDSKFARWMAGNPVQIDAALGQTIAQFDAAPDGPALRAAYAAAVRRAPAWCAAGRHLFVHAAFDLRMLSLPAPSMAERRGVPRALLQHALYGEANGGTDDQGRLVRTYGWLDQIPDGLTVWIGHDVRDTRAPVTRTGRLGGRLVNLDTGADRGGPLSHADLPAAELTGAPDATQLDPAPSEPLLTVLVGPSGAGKSSWTRANAAPEAVISSDAIRQELYGDHREQGDRLTVIRIFIERARARLAAGQPAVLDATHLSRRDRLASVALVPPHHPVRYVLIDRPLEEKLRDAGWRRDVVLEPDTGRTLVEVHHARAQDTFQHAVDGDGLANVIVEDRRR